MKVQHIRIIMFAAALLLTAALPLLLCDRIALSRVIALGFAVAAEALLFLPSLRWREAGFPLRLPLRLFVFPAYAAATLALAVFSELLTWRRLLALELLFAFAILILICIAALAEKSKENR